MGHIWTLSGNSYRDALSLLQRAGSTDAIAADDASQADDPIIP